MTGCDAKADSQRVYKLPVISDVETTLSISKEISIKGRPVHLTVLYESVRGKPIASIYRSHSPRFIENMVKKTSDVMDSFLRERGIAISECRGYKYNLIITVVSKDILQDDIRFRGFYKMKYGVERLVGQTLYGFYDPTLEIPNNSSILVTHMGRQIDEEVLAHELAHYWWDRLCVAAKSSGTSEAFAQAFDQYYMRSR
jgi:hypothetical protein